MNFVFQPWQLLLIILAGWLNRQQAAVIEYLRTENQVTRSIRWRHCSMIDWVS